MEMKMSYRQAWQMVESINEKAGLPLVVSQRGGKGGGKALLTEKGEEVLKIFDDLQNKFTQFLNEQSERFEL
jgi:molybdate transport system regulatory protein